MHSLFERFLPVQMCILRPNQANWSERRVVPIFMSVLDSNKNVLSSTQSMHKISNSVPYVKVPGWWLTSCPFDIGELSLCEN